MNTKERNEKEKQATRVLYISVAAMLVVMAVIVTLSSILSRVERPAPVTTTDDGKTTTAAPDTEGSRAPTTQAGAPDYPEVTLPVAADGEDEEADAPYTPPIDTVPTLSAPVQSGVLSREHSGRDLVYSSTMEDYRAHIGIDVNAALGDKVYACAVGTITDVWYDAMMGRCVKVEHNGGLELIYRNMAEELCEGVGIGSSLLVGDAIGYVGESAMIELAQEPHLHLEAKVDGKYVDPMTLMSDAAKTSLMQSDTGYEQ